MLLIIGQNNAVLNGDGFGVGWYHTRSDAPALFKDVEPAWNNVNLREICMAASSSCIVSHVRAATIGSTVSRENAHPFKVGRLLFCHNGHVEDFMKIKRALHALLTDEAYSQVQGTTDSESVFALIVSNLDDPYRTRPFEPEALVNAVQKTIAQIEQLLAQHEVHQGFTTLNLCLTDGNTVVVSRFCDKPNIPPPSLYFSYASSTGLLAEIQSKNCTEVSPGDGSEIQSEEEPALPTTRASLDEEQSGGGLQFKDVDPSDGCFICSSAPLTRSTVWHPIARNSIVFGLKGETPIVVPIGVQV